MGHLVADTNGDGIHCRDFRAEAEIRYLQSADTADLQHIDSHAVGVNLHDNFVVDLSHPNTSVNYSDICGINQRFYQPGNYALSKLLKITEGEGSSGDF